MIPALEHRWKQLLLLISSAWILLSFVVNVLAVPNLVQNTEANLWGYQQHLTSLSFGLLVAYHVQFHRQVRRRTQGLAIGSSPGLRLWNEVGTVLLIAIVCVASLKSPARAGLVVLAFAAVGAVIFGILAARRRVSPAWCRTSRPPAPQSACRRLW